MSKIGNINAAVGLFLNGQNPTARYHSFRKCFEMVFTNMESWSTVVDLITKYGKIIKMCRFLSHPRIGVRSTERASMSDIDVVFVIHLLIFSMCRASLSRYSSRWSECRHRGYSSRPPLVASSRTSRICIVIILLASGGRRSASRWIRSSLLRSPVASGRR